MFIVIVLRSNIKGGDYYYILVYMDGVLIFLDETAY